MIEICKSLIEQKKRFESLRKSVEEQLNEMREGKIRIVNNEGRELYYLKTEENRKQYPQGQYIKKNDIKIAGEIIQRDYNKAVLKEINKEIKAVEKFLIDFQPDKLKYIYENTNKSRQQWITPWILSDEDYIRKWLEVAYEGKPFDEEHLEIYTEQGERVRSKSEKIIADKLYKMGVPYRYEAPLHLRGMGIVYPDFTCLRIRDRKEIIWEHFGMMGDPEYCKKALKKIDEYTRNGYIQGRDIIYTFESQEYALNTICVDTMMKTIFS